MKDHDHPLGPRSRAIHAGYDPDPQYGAVSPPIYRSSTFAFRNAQEGADRFAGRDPGYIYTRMGNPTVRALEQSVATLEKGYGGLATASGMAAVTTVYLSLLSQGEHVVCTDAVYGPSRIALEQDFPRWGVESTFVDSARVEALEGAVRPNTRLLFIETPANPTISLTDLEAAARIAHRAGAILAVDNTFATPHLQNPIDHGADLVIHSMTKFLNGHTDVVAGMIVAREEELFRQVRTTLYRFGGTIDPEQAWLVHRGIRSLPLRVERSQENARALAAWLEDHPKVEWVRYPGLKSHPQHELAARQMRGPGSMISFGVHGGVEGGRALLDSVKLATLAVSLGGIETLIQHPASMTHAGMPKDEREQAGISDGLVRISVGCEDLEDLRADLAQALECVVVETPVSV